MSSAVLKFTAAGSTNLQPVGPDGGAVLTGFEIFNTAASARFVKIYWGAPGSFSGGADSPVVGTDVPAITIEIDTVKPARQAYFSGIRGRGRMFVATTVNAADSDSAAVTAGDLIVSIFYE